MNKIIWGNDQLCKKSKIGRSRGAWKSAVHRGLVKVVLRGSVLRCDLGGDNSRLRGILQCDACEILSCPEAELQNPPCGW